MPPPSKREVLTFRKVFLFAKGGWGSYGTQMRRILLTLPSVVKTVVL